MKFLRGNLVCLVALMFFGAVTTARAQNYSISWYKIAGGGGTSTNNGYSLSGTIGQVDAGTMSGGGYTLNGGFWGIYAAVQTAGSPLLTITPSGSSVVLSWPASSTGFYLQQSATVNSPGWSNVSQSTNVISGTNSVTIPVARGNLFFRLVNP